MNSDLAYFDVSHNIEIFHLNDSNEFENEINKQLEKNIEPMEPTLETINLGNDENPCLIKICSILNEKEKKERKKERKKMEKRKREGKKKRLSIYLNSMGRHKASNVELLIIQPLKKLLGIRNATPP